MTATHEKRRLLIFIVAYEAASTIAGVLKRIPGSLIDLYHVEVLIIDDASSDETFEASRQVLEEEHFPYLVHVLRNPVNQGYGGNQKIGYHYAIENNFDFVALLHGDGQYAPERLPELVEPLREGKADAVFGSRMLTQGEALKGGMPLYKYYGNKILTWFENRMLRSQFSEFHSGYRVYSVKALAAVPFDLNTNVFHFDTEIIIQLFNAGFRIMELPIPTYYGDEICRVDGLKYALDVIIAVTKARAQTWGLFYSRNYDCAREPSGPYTLKLGYRSPHSEVLRHVRPGTTVLDLGCAGGYVGQLLRERLGCKVTGVDRFPLSEDVSLDHFIEHDLNNGLPAIDYSRFDYVLLLDVIEHLSEPEKFVTELRNVFGKTPEVVVLASSGNVGFFIPRLMLALGQFNYGKRGILDMTHTRLFTFRSFRRLFVQSGFTIRNTTGIPGPYPLALGEGKLSTVLLALNEAAMRVSKGMFAYQIFLVAQPLPTLSLLLAMAEEKSHQRALRGEPVSQDER
jgi:glycosyltransferase involved in cell wall biosynthesis